MNLDSVFTLFSYISANMTMTMAGKIFSMLAMIWILLAFLKSHFDAKSPINLNDIFVDSSGKIGGSQMRLNVAFITATWVLVYYSLNGQLSEWLFGAYLAAFVYDRAKSRAAATPTKAVAHSEDSELIPNLPQDDK